MNKIVYVFVFLFLNLLGIEGQKGLPYISYYVSQPGFENRNWAVCQDKHQNVYFANKNGITEFDGFRWRTHHLPYIPLDLKRSPHDGKLFVLSDRNYGKLSRDNFGNLVYDSLSNVVEVDRNMKKIWFSSRSVIFYGDRQIYFLDLTEHTLQFHISTGSANRYAGLIISGERVWVNVAGNGLMEIEGDSLHTDKAIRFTANRNILFTLPYSDEEVLVGFERGELMLFNGTSFRKYEISNQNYFREYGLGEGAIVNDTTMAISTLYGGVLIINLRDGKVLYSLNYESGLPEDEIFSIHAAGAGGLWITYQYGACRVDLGLPVSEYTNIPGLAGLLNNSVWYNGIFYVATSEGLFFLDEVKNYDEVEVLLRQNVPVKEGEVQEGNQAEDDKRGFIRNFLDRVRQSRQETEEEIPEQTTRYIRKKVSKLKSVKHVFKKVKGLNSACRELFPTQTTLLAGTTSGLYGINDSIAIRLSNSRYINDIHQYDSSSYLVASNDGIEIMRLLETGWLRDKNEQFLNEPIFGVTRQNEDIWLSGYNEVIRISASDSLNHPTIYSFESYSPEEYHINERKDTLFLFSPSNVRYYDPVADTFLIYKTSRFSADHYQSVKYFESPNEFRWLQIDNDVVFLDNNQPESIQLQQHLGLFNNITSLTFNPDNGNYWLIDDQKRLFSVSPKIIEHQYKKFRIGVEKIINNYGQLIDLNDLSFMPEELPVTIQLSAPFFPGGNQTKYQYTIKNRMDGWSPWSESPEFSQFIESGDYIFMFRAKNFLGQLTDTEEIRITVITPFYQKPWFYLSLSPIFLVLLYVFFMIRERKIKRDKALLETKVVERTIEIQDQKKQIEIQRDEIKDSITYASKIQRAILPSQKLFDRSFSNYFILFKPRDIVSGDFYWITEKNGKVIFAAADCTGHGVPGAFMSMLGNSFLNEITKDHRKQSANDILEQLRSMITTALSQSGKDSRRYDGMDIALCIFDKKRAEIEFSGAHNPIYLIRNKKLIEYKANRIPIGYFPEEMHFTSEHIKVKKGDMIYLFSDGFPDQFGGEKNKKFTKKRFKNTLVSISDLQPEQQKAKLEEIFYNWKGENKQIDDVMVMGFLF